MGSKAIGQAPRDDADPDAELMISFQRGDPDAFAALVRRFQGRVVSLAYRYLGSAADAEDLAQEVFLRVYRAKESYEPTARFSTWIYRITANASLNFLRGKKARRKVSGPLPAGNDDDRGAGIDRRGLQRHRDLGRQPRYRRVDGAQHRRRRIQLDPLLNRDEKGERHAKSPT